MFEFVMMAIIVLMVLYGVAAIRVWCGHCSNVSQGIKDELLYLCNAFFPCEQQGMDTITLPFLLELERKIIRLFRYCARTSLEKGGENLLITWEFRGERFDDMKELIEKIIRKEISSFALSPSLRYRVYIDGNVLKVLFFHARKGKV